MASLTDPNARRPSGAGPSAEADGGAALSHPPSVRDLRRSLVKRFESRSIRSIVVIATLKLRLTARSGARDAGNSPPRRPKELPPACSASRKQPPAASGQVGRRRDRCGSLPPRWALLAHLPPTWRFHMARKTIVVSDLSGDAI